VSPDPSIWALAKIEALGAEKWSSRTDARLSGRHIRPPGAGLAVLYASACALPTALTAAAYGAAGQFGAFWFCNFGSMRIYVAMSPGNMVRNLKEGLLCIWPLCTA